VRDWKSAFQLGALWQPQRESPQACHLRDPREPLVPLVRQVPQTTSVLKSAVESLAQGPTKAEEAVGFKSAWPDEARDAPIHASLRDGNARKIDYDLNSIGNFTTSTWTSQFYEEALATAFQFDIVQSVQVVDRSEGGCPGEYDCSPHTRKDRKNGSEIPLCPREYTPRPDAVCNPG
jgi:hypothetical protein